MFTSAGIDNFELRLPVTEDEANALLNACQWRTKTGFPVLLRNEHSPLILLHFVPGKVLADLNVPKIAFGHNVRLAGPEQVRQAIRVLETNTKSHAPRLKWQRAPVSRLHLTFTRNVPDFKACAALSKTPRGYWPFDFDNANGYHNAKGKNLPVNWYDKREQIRSEGLRLPNDVALEMESLEHALFRFEARLNQSVYSELKKHGAWNGLSFLAEDLFGAGFVSAMQYLQWRFERHVPVPVDRTPGIHAGMSAREYAALNTRRTANTERMREQARDDHKAGRITTETLNGELARIVTLERRELAQSLHASLEQEVKETKEKFVGTIKEHYVARRREYTY